MKSVSPVIIMVGCALLIGFAGIRLGCSSGGNVEQRDASRVFVCEECGEVTPFDPDFISAQYEAGGVEQGRGGPRFTCSSCNESGIRTVVLDFTAYTVRCSECGKALIDSPAEAVKALKQGDAKLGADGEPVFRCSDCGDFHGKLESRDPAVEPEE